LREGEAIAEPFELPPLRATRDMANVHKAATDGVVVPSTYADRTRLLDGVRHNRRRLASLSDRVWKSPAQVVVSLRATSEAGTPARAHDSADNAVRFQILRRRPPCSGDLGSRPAHHRVPATGRIVYLFSVDGAPRLDPADEGRIPNDWGSEHSVRHVQRIS
jgi:hypothetical protein